MPIQGNHDIEVVINDTWDGEEYILKDEDDVAIDITGCTILMEVKDIQGKNTVLSLSSDDSEISLSDPVNGKCRILPVIITGIDPNTYKHDIQFTYPSGRIKTYIFGVFNIIRSSEVNA